MADKTVKIGLLGCGTVGRGLVELIGKNRSLIRERSGVDLKISKVLVRDLKKDRPGVDKGLLTLNPDDVLKNGCDLIVELIGGIDPARQFISEAIESKKSVVTANKALLALTGADLFRAAATKGVRLGFEASVCGGIPIIRALQSGLVGNHIGELTGILNGTCNYILTQMTEQAWSFELALKEAQARGFAEADPTLDIDGHDAAQKVEILAELAFGVKVAAGAVSVEGIRLLSEEDIRSAKELGFVIKHIAVARDLGATLDVRVHPALLPTYHPLATVRHENNAVLVKGDAVGEMLFYGKGAGAAPTASAVLSDIIDIAVNDRHARQAGVRRSAVEVLPALPDSRRAGRDRPHRHRARQPRHFDLARVGDAGQGQAGLRKREDPGAFLPEVGAAEVDRGDFKVACT